QDLAGRAAGQGYLRPGAGGTGEGAQGAGVAGRGARQPAQGPRVPAARRRVHRGRDRHVDLVQAREGGRRHPTPPAPLRVLPLLRLLRAEEPPPPPPLRRGGGGGWGRFRRPSQDELAEVLLLEDLAETAADVPGVDDHVLAGQVRPFVAD